MSDGSVVQETHQVSANANKRYDPLHPNGNPKSVKFGVPVVGEPGQELVKVAAIAVMNSAGQILVGYNNKRAAWDIPQGVVETGELPSEAILRELEEETGISIGQENLTNLGSFRHVTPEFVFPWSTHLYALEYDGPLTAVNTEPDKCAQLSWFAPSQLPTPRGLSLRILLTLLGR